MTAQNPKIVFEPLVWETRWLDGRVTKDVYLTAVRKDAR